MSFRKTFDNFEFGDIYIIENEDEAYDFLVNNKLEAIKVQCMPNTYQHYYPFIRAFKELKADYIFEDAPPPKVEAAFLIHAKGGLLIDKYEREQTALDADIFSSMLNAVDNFIKDTMRQVGRTGELNVMGYKNFRIIIETSGSVALAVLLTGHENEILVDTMRSTLSLIEREYSTALSDWNGTHANLPHIGDLLNIFKKYDGQIPDVFSRRDFINVSVKKLIKRVAAEKKLVFFFENIQWADNPTLVLLLYLTNRLPNNAVIISTYSLSDVEFESLLGDACHYGGLYKQAQYCFECIKSHPAYYYKQPLTYTHTGQREQAYKICQEGLQEFPQRAEPIFGMGLVNEHTGKLEQAAKDYEQALSLCSDAALQGKIRFRLGNLLRVLGDYNRSYAMLKTALTIFQTTGHQADIANVYNSMGILNYVQGNYDKASYYFDKAYLIRESCGDFEGLAGVVINTGLIHIQKKQYREASASFCKGLYIAQKYGDHLRACVALINIGETEIVQEKFDHAIKTFQSCIEIAKKLGMHEFIAESYRGMATVYLKQGLLDMYEKLQPELEASYSLCTTRRSIAEYSILQAIYANKTGRKGAARLFFEAGHKQLQELHSESYFNELEMLWGEDWQALKQDYIETEATENKSNFDTKR